MPKRTQGLNDDDTSPPAAAAPSPTSSAPRRTLGLADEPATAPTLPSSAQPQSPSNVPLFSLTGPDKAGEWLQTAIRSGTYNLADLAAAGVTGTSLASQVAQAKAERQDIGPLGALSADIAGHLANPLNRLGGGSIPAMMVTGGLGQGVSAAAHGENPVGPAAAGFATGGLLGVGGQMVRPGMIPNILYHSARPVAATIGAHLGGPFGAGAATAAMDALKPPAATGAVYPWVKPLLPWINSGVQGAESGQMN